jgi:tRNA(Arg) A34 adenosine deaminase TadA
MNPPFFTLHLPEWLEKLAQQTNHPFPATEDRMHFVIELSRQNVRYDTGGPFAAAIFRADDGSLLAMGVNLVLAGHCSVLHAEIVAILAAQAKAVAHDLSSPEFPPYELVSSTEPCAMCLGAVTWSGIQRLVCGARGEDAEKTGFDEGEKPPEWPKALQRRGITVLQDVCRDQAAAVLRDYRDSGGIIYNPFRGKAPSRSPA